MWQFLTLWLVVTGFIGINGLDLQCKIQKFPRFKDSLTGCNATNVNITSRDQIFESVNKQDLSIFNGSAYEILQIHNQVVHYVPQGLGRIFPNMKVLIIEDCLLQAIRKESLSQFPRLSKIYLRDNKLQYLPADLFEGNLDLEVIVLNNNDIKYVGQEILTPLKKLKYAHFRANPCIDVKCENLLRRELMTETFRKNCTFKTFDIKCKLDSTVKHCEALNLTVEVSASFIEKIVTINDEEMNQNLNLIEKLSIVEQNLQFLPLNLADKLPNLAEITIERSKLLEITQGNFANLKSLTSLKVVKNKLRTISEHSFDDNVKLEELILSYSWIEVIADNTFSSLSYLEVLDLSHNYLTSVDNVNFKNLVSMQTLKLNNNKLRDIKSGLFYTCSELLYLDISSNDIKILASDLVSLNNKIIEFHAADNDVKIIDNQLLIRLNRAQIIDLTESCSDVLYKRNETSGISFDEFLITTMTECSKN